jgi:glycerol-3-phosphate acyltransferase PlsY
MSSTLKRALVHVFLGLSISISALSFHTMVLPLALGVATSVFLAVDVTRLRAPGINRWFLWLFKPVLREKEMSHLTGASYMLLASIIALLAFPRDIAVLALSFLAVGDVVATLVGQWAGRRKFLGKSLEGELACFIACVVIGFGFNFYYAGLNFTLPTIILGSVCATLAEALPLPIDDNLTMPLFAGAVMTIIQM